MNIVSLWRYVVIAQVWTQCLAFGAGGKCQSFEFDLPLTGKYCPWDDAPKKNLLPHECKAVCIQSSNFAAFNYNYTANDCTHSSAPFIQAMAAPTMEFGIFTPHMEAQHCYEWRLITLRDWDRAVEDNQPNAYVIRMLKGGSYYVGHFGQTYSECYANNSAFFIHLNGYPCESLWIQEDCTVYSQP